MSEKAARVAYGALCELEKQLAKCVAGEAANYEKMDTLANVVHASSQLIIDEDKSGDGPEFD